MAAPNGVEKDRAKNGKNGDVTTDQPQETERYAKIPHLWALGVGAVISGDFFGWQAGLEAGLGGLAICLSIVTVLYVLLSFTVAELSSAIPAGGGPYVFALRSMGTMPAFFAGLAESLKCIVTIAVIAVGIGSYLTEIFGTDDRFSPLWWLLFYVIFVGLNIFGVAASFVVQLLVTILSIIELVVFYVGAATVADYNKWVLAEDCACDIAANSTTTAMSECRIGDTCPEEWLFSSQDPSERMEGLVRGLSFSLWFYLGIEELPLAAEETINPERNMKWGIIISMFTLVALAYLTMFFNSIISPGAKAISQVSSPLLVGYQTVFGDNKVTSGFAWLLTIGLITSFHSFIFCMARLLFAIARDNLFPKVLSKLHPTRHTPWVALIVGSFIGYMIAVILYLGTDITVLGSVLINLALLGALISYIFQVVAFVILRVKQPELPRPYSSPFGIPGAVITLVLSVIVIVAIVYTGINKLDYIFSVVGGIIYFIIGALYYVFYARHQFTTSSAPPIPSSRDPIEDDTRV